MAVQTPARNAQAQKSALKNTTRSLVDLLGKPYLNAVCMASATLQNVPWQQTEQLASTPVEFYPPSLQFRLDDLIESVGAFISEPFQQSNSGAGTNAFNKATTTGNSPLAALGFVRIGEDGRAYFTSKSEHYHASLGHAFPGYKLVEMAHQLGIPNATHNNTRGHITRLLEQELVRTANGLPRGDTAALQKVLASTEPHVLNRVINLETGSLAVEAAFKMMLARFYHLEDTSETPKYSGKTPVFLVMADFRGGKKANYHGTTVFTQFMRGMWPDLYELLEQKQVFVVKACAINDINHFQQLMEQYDQGQYKVAGFFHEIVLMNYGGIRLEQQYLRQAYEICHAHDVPIIVDEIQSCMWSPELYLFREYGLKPDFVSIGKGFPGGEYPASRILFSAEMDTLNQFGALVTNGQEELASLAYLVTMEFVQENADYIRELGEYYETRLKDLASRYPKFVASIEGCRHLSAIFFHQVEDALAFVKSLNHAGVDISAQTYKADCPPAALTKLPVTTSYKAVDWLLTRMDEALAGLA